MTNIFAQGQQGQQGTNIFAQNNAARNTGGFNSNTTTNIFAQGQQGRTGNMFAQGNQGNQQNTGMFNQQNMPAQNIFAQGQQTNQGNTNMFNQGNQGTTNMFNQGNQGNQNMFAQGNQGNQNMFAQGTQGNTNMFNQGYQQGNMFNQQNQQMNNQPNMPYNAYNLANSTPEQQQQIINSLTPESIRDAIRNYRNLLDPKRLQGLALSRDNTLAGEKANKMATNFNIKPQVIYVKKQVKDNVVTPIKTLKDKNEILEKQTANFSGKVLDKLQKYKQRLVQAVSQSKMVEQVKKEVDELDGQMRDFFRPLFNAQQNRSNFSFFDPDAFCVSVSERLLKNMTTLDNKMDELLACEGAANQQAIETGAVVEQLVDYYQNVAVTLREFSEKYNSIKRKVLHKTRLSNPDQAQRRITEKASQIVSKEMQTYELLKEIELLLEKREKRISKIGRIL